MRSDCCDTHQAPLKVFVVSLRRFQETLIKIDAMVVFFETDEKLQYCKSLTGSMCSRNMDLFSSGGAVDERSSWTLEAQKVIAMYMAQKAGHRWPLPINLPEVIDCMRSATAREGPIMMQTSDIGKFYQSVNQCTLIHDCQCC